MKRVLTPDIHWDAEFYILIALSGGERHVGGYRAGIMHNLHIVCKTYTTTRFYVCQQYTVVVMPSTERMKNNRVCTKYDGDLTHVRLVDEQDKSTNRKTNNGTQVLGRCSSLLFPRAESGAHKQKWDACSTSTSSYQRRAAR